MSTVLMDGNASSPQVAILRDLERRIDPLADHVRRLRAHAQANRPPDREHAAAIASQLWDMYQLASRLPLCAQAATTNESAVTPVINAA